MGTATKGLGAITLMLAALAACGAEQQVTEFPAPPSTSTTRMPALSAGEFTAAFDAICSRLALDRAIPTVRPIGGFDRAVTLVDQILQDHQAMAEVAATVRRLDGPSSSVRAADRFAMDLEQGLAEYALAISAADAGDGAGWEAAIGAAESVMPPCRLAGP